MNPRNLFPTTVLLGSVVWVLGPPCSTVEAVPECRVIPISSVPPEESVSGSEITVALEFARLTLEVECTGWGGEGLDSYQFKVGPLCPPPPCPVYPQPPDDECSPADPCEIGDCINGRCPAIARVAGHPDGVFDGQQSISEFDETSGIFYVSALDNPAVDDGNFHYFGTALMDVAYYPGRSFDFTLEDALFYLGDGTTVPVTTVQTAHVEMLEPPIVPSPGGLCGCGLFPWLFIPLVCGATHWQVRRTRKPIAKQEVARS